MKRIAWLCVAWFALAGALADDVVERRTLVPDPQHPHGEVRVVRRGDVTVVQTLVHSRAVRRVAGAIAEKERDGWPPGSPGSEDSARYVESLARIARAVRQSGDADADRRRALVIEFPQGGPVTIGGARVAVEGDGLRLLETVDPHTVLEVSPRYLGRNRLRILTDAFGVDEATASSWLSGAKVAHP